MKNSILLLLTLVSASLFAQEVTGQYDKIEKFNQGVAVVWKLGKCGLMQQDGKEIIKPQYDNIGRFGNDGIAYTTKKGLKGLITMTGKVIVDNIYGDIGRFNGSWPITARIIPPLSTRMLSYLFSINTLPCLLIIPAKPFLRVIAQNPLKRPMSP